MEEWVKNKIIPKGKWIRTRDGVIQHRHREASTFVEVMVANTPQELVRIGDLVEAFKREDSYRTKMFIIEEQREIELIYDLYAIYTPNQDKTQYTLQYRKD